MVLRPIRKPGNALQTRSDGAWRLRRRECMRTDPISRRLAVSPLCRRWRPMRERSREGWQLRLTPAALRATPDICRMAGPDLDPCRWIGSGFCRSAVAEDGHIVWRVFKFSRCRSALCSPLAFRRGVFMCNVSHGIRYRRRRMVAGLLESQGLDAGSGARQRSAR